MCIRARRHLGPALQPCRSARHTAVVPHRRRVLGDPRSPAVVFSPARPSAFPLTCAAGGLWSGAVWAQGWRRPYDCEAGRVSVCRGKRRTKGSKFFCAPPWTGRTPSACSSPLRHSLRSLSNSAPPRSKPHTPASPISKARAGGDGAGSGGGSGLGAAMVRDPKNKFKNVPQTKARIRGGRQHSVGSRRSGGSGGSGVRGVRRRTEKESDEAKNLKVLTYRDRILEMYRDTDF